MLPIFIALTLLADLSDLYQRHKLIINLWVNCYVSLAHSYHQETAMKAQDLAIVPYFRGDILCRDGLLSSEAVVYNNGD